MACLKQWYLKHPTPLEVYFLLLIVYFHLEKQYQVELNIEII